MAAILMTYSQGWPHIYIYTYTVYLWHSWQGNHQIYSHTRCKLYTVIHGANCKQSYTVQILYGHIQCKLCTVLAIPMYYLGQQRRALKLSSITGITFSSDIHISLAAKQHKSRPFYSSKALNSSIPSLIFLPTHALLISSTGRGLSI